MNDNYKLTTEEAKRIIDALKQKVNEANLSFPQLGKKLEFDVFTKDDGTKITGNHLHIYNEDTEMSDAIPFNIDNPDLYKYCLEFFKKFNIIKENWDIYYQEEI